MRNSVVLLALCVSFLGLSVSAQVKTNEDRSAKRLSPVERRMVEIELDAQLHSYRKIVMALNQSEIEWAVLQLDDSASRGKLHAMQARLALLQNLKETAVLKALKFEKQLLDQGDAYGKE